MAGKPDIEAVMKDPWEYFKTPMDVVHDARFSHEEKHKILESWALDAQLLSQAEAENMPGRDKERPKLQDVKLAQLELEKE